ncbi:MAG TPA: dihydrodipicolinate synthase family protein, partial [Opitutaceae bacterium]
MSAFTERGHTRAQLRGYSIVPMLTPFTTEGRLDEPAVARIVGNVIAGGCQGLMVCGTTGEFASMTVSMRIRTVELAVAAAAGRAVIFGGIGDTSPAHSITLAHGFLAEGADAVVANLPSYYPLTPAMMESYFVGLADAIDGPLYLYNIPQTTRQSIPFDVISRLSTHLRIAGIKDSEPDGARQEQLCALFANRSDFAVFCGSVAF